MRRLLFVIFTILLLASCDKKQTEVRVSIDNPSDFDRMDEMVEIPLDSIMTKVKLTDTLVYVVKNAAGEIIPSQVTYDRKLIFQPELKANESKEFILVTDTSRLYAQKVFSRFIPEKGDVFVWENDKVAFRMYGQASSANKGSGIDAWYKSTPNLIISNWYKNDSDSTIIYQENAEEGMAVYDARFSLGMGSMAPYVNDKLWYNENFHSEEVLDNGPLRTTFKLIYKNIDIDRKSVAENRIVSLDAGSQLSKVTQAYTIKEPMAVAAGILKREADELVITAQNYVICSESVKRTESKVFFAMVFPEGITETSLQTNSNKSENYTHILAITQQEAKKPIVYYTGYGWTKFGFGTIADFEKYVNDFSKGLKQPLLIKYK